MRRLPAPLRDGLVVTLLAVCILGVMRLSANSHWAQALEAASLDQRFRLRGHVAVGPETVVILADDASLAKLGGWPVSRHILARVVRLLDAAGARVIGFDILFPDPDAAPPVGWRALVREVTTPRSERTREVAMGTLARLAADDPDADFAAAMRQSGRVILPFSATPNGPDGTEPDSLAASAFQSFDPSLVSPMYLFSPRSVMMPVDPLARAAAGLGDVDIAYDVDGRLRYSYLSLPYQGDFLPSLPIRAAAAWLGVPWSEVALAPNKAVRIGRNIIPTDAAGRIVVNFRGPTGSFPTFSLSDLLDHRIPPAALRGRIVLVGGSFTGDADSNPTPFDQITPGTEYLATIIDMILHHDFIQPLDPVSRTLLPFWTIGAIAIAAVIGSRLPTLLGGIVALIPLLGFSVSAQRAFDRGIWVPETASVMALLVGGLGLILFRYLMVDQEGRRVKSAFRRYLSPALVNRIAAHPERLSLGGENRALTLMFCDIRDFSGVAEGYRDDPQGLTRLINRFLTPMTDIILEQGGTIDKYMGDCIMAFWNAPLPDPAHAIHACDAALAMQPALDRLNAELAREGGAPLRIGIGLNTGSCVVGNMGSEQRYHYSALGDAVNLASRLEGQSKTYGVGIIVGAETRQHAPDHAMLEIDQIVVKGKAEAVAIFALLGSPEQAASKDFQGLEVDHRHMLVCYRRQDWDGAEAALRRCRDLAPALDDYYNLYAERIRTFRQTPPPTGWDGVYRASSK